MHKNGWQHNDFAVFCRANYLACVERWRVTVTQSPLSFSVAAPPILPPHPLPTSPTMRPAHMMMLCGVLVSFWAGKGTWWGGADARAAGR